MLPDKMNLERTDAPPIGSRLNLPGVPLHVVQRGNYRQACFFTEEDCRFYLC